MIFLHEVKSMIDIMQLNQSALEAKKRNPQTINASIGMYFDDDKKLLNSAVVKNALQRANPESYLAYKTVSGGKIFHDTIVNWLFRFNQDTLPNDLIFKTCATPGGSGVISSVFNIYSKPNDKVLISDIRWQYERFLHITDLTILEHKLFLNDHFNMKDFQEKLDFLSKNQKRIIIVLNDPCHNPSGYTMKVDEIKQIVDVINQYENNEIIFLYDLAYFDFDSSQDFKYKLTSIFTLKKHVLTILAFSGSKTLGLYGLRIGAALYFSKDHEKVLSFDQKMHNHSMGSWSTSSALGIDLINDVLSNNQISFMNDLKTMQATMDLRASTFLVEAKENKLDHYPYTSGFYILLKSGNPMRDYEKLAAHDIFLVPLQYGLRIALCSLSLSEVKGLATKINSILSKE